MTSYFCGKKSWYVFAWKCFLVYKVSDSVQKHQNKMALFVWRGSHILQSFNHELFMYLLVSLTGGIPCSDINMSCVLLRDRNTRVCTECFCTSCQIKHISMLHYIFKDFFIQHVRLPGKLGQIFKNCFGFASTLLCQLLCDIIFPWQQFYYLALRIFGINSTQLWTNEVHTKLPTAPCLCLDGHIKEPYEMSMALVARP